GCAHGYLTLADGAEVRYLTTQAYAPDAVGGVRYDDVALGIEWPRAVGIVSEQDQSWPLLAESDESPFACSSSIRRSQSARRTGTPYESVSSVRATWPEGSRRTPRPRRALRSSRSPTGRSNGRRGSMPRTVRVLRARHRRSPSSRTRSPCARR